MMQLWLENPTVLLKTQDTSINGVLNSIAQVSIVAAIILGLLRPNLFLNLLLFAAIIMMATAWLGVGPAKESFAGVPTGVSTGIPPGLEIPPYENYERNVFDRGFLPHSLGRADRNSGKNAAAPEHPTRELPFDSRTFRSLGKDGGLYTDFSTEVTPPPGFVGKKRGILRPIAGNSTVMSALKANRDYNQGYGRGKIHDRENAFFRDIYSRQRLRTAIGESNRTSGGHRYGGPQNTAIYSKLPDKTYLDSMGIYE